MQTFRLEKMGEDGWERVPLLSSWEDWEDAPVNENGDLVLKDVAVFHYFSCAKLSTVKHTAYIRRANYGTKLYDPLEVGEYRVLVYAETSDDYNIQLVSYFTVTEAPA